MNFFRIETASPRSTVAKLRAATLMAGVLLASAAPAGASDPLEPPDLSRYVRWGFLRVRPTIHLTNLGYDDNIFYRTGNQAKEGDYTATVSPKVEGVVLFGSRAFFTFDEQLDYVAFLRHGGESYFNQRGSGRVTFPFRSMGVFVEGAYNRFKDRPTSELDVRPARRELRGGGGLIFRLGSRTDLEIGRTHSRWNYRDPDYSACLRPNPPGCDLVVTIGQLLDRVERGERLKARYRFAGESRLLLETALLDVRFDDPEVGRSPDIGRDSEQRRWLAGLEVGTKSRLSGAVKAGRARFDVNTPGRPDFSGWVGEGQLAYRMGTGTTVRAGGKRDLGYAVWEANQYYQHTTWEARVIHYFNRLLGAEAGGSAGRLTFPGAATTARKDRIGLTDLGVRFRFRERPDGRRIEYRFTVTRFRRDSTRPELDQSRTLLGFGAIFGY